MKKIAELDVKQKIVLLAILGLAIIVTFFFPNVLEPIENMALNYHIRNTNPVQNYEKIVLIMGTDETLEQMRNWPWSSSVYAGLISGSLDGAKTIVLCIDFMPTDAAVYDFKLATAMQEHGNVVLSGTYLLESDSFIQPRQVLRQSAAEVGYYQDLSNRDGIVRRYKLVVIDEGGTLHPSPVYAALSRSGYDLQLDRDTHTLSVNDANGVHLHHIHLDSDYSYWITGTEQENYEIYEMIDVIEGRVSADVFEDALVFVGASVSVEEDLISTPNGDVYASVVAANAVNATLAEFCPDNISRGLLTLLVVIFYIICVFSALAMPVTVSFLVPAVSSVSLFITSHQLFINGIFYLPVTLIIFWCWIAYVAAAFLRFRTMSAIVDHTTIPLQQTFSIGIAEEANSGERLVRHLLGLQGLIESTGLFLLEPLITDSHEFVQEHKEKLSDSGYDQDSYTIVKNPGKEKPRYHLLIPHPKTDLEEADEYTLLGANDFKSPYAVQSMVSLIRNASLYYKALQYGEEKHRLSFNIVKCMVAAMDAKDPVTAGHSQRVAKVALQIAEKMGFTGRELEELELAAIVHDIGKIGIQDHILNKKGVFSNHEFMEMKTHPAKGISIMAPSGLSENANDAILNHHERPDGRGYPGGKGQDEIGLFAKIIKISDVSDALLSERQYKKAWPLEEVCNLLYRGRGSEFDTEITDLFLDMIKPEGWIPPEASDDRPRTSPLQYEQYMQYGARAIRRVNGYLDNLGNSGVIDESEIDFDSKNSFLGLEWGEPFFEINFVMKRPYLLEYDGDREYLYFALRLQGQLSGVVVYTFLKGYLTSGILFLSHNNWEEEGLIDVFGKPIVDKENSILWDMGKSFVLLKRDVTDHNDVIAFITKYEFSEEEL